MTPIQEVVDHYFGTLNLDLQDIRREVKKDKTFYARHLRNAKDLIELSGSVSKAKEEIDKIAEWANGNGFDYNINTVIKRWLYKK